jgi:uncharacterized protein (TIGR02284 family)
MNYETDKIFIPFIVLTRIGMKIRYDFLENNSIKISVMEKNEKVIGVLNDLIRINHDRVVGYEKGIEELKDGDNDLKTLFSRYMQESRGYASELTTEVKRLGGEPAEGTTNSGKIYRVWMDLKAVIKGHDRKTVLENCEFGEDAAQKAYDMVRQKTQLKTGHDEVKRLRDLQKATS